MEESQQEELRVFVLDECIIRPDPPPAPSVRKSVELAGLAGVFIPKIIDMAIGGLAALLKEAGKDKTVQASGQAFGNLYLTDEKQVLGPNPKVGAVLAVWGVFSNKNGNQTAKTDTALLKLEELNYVPKNARIGIIFEAAVRLASDRSAFYLDTRHFSVRNFIADGSKERAFVITLGVTSPSTSVAGTTIAAGHIDLGRWNTGGFFDAPLQNPEKGASFRSNLMPWGQISEASKLAHQADVAVGKARNREYMPVTFNLTISETEDGNKFLGLLGELLEKARGDATTEISKLITPEERAKAAAERQTANDKLYKDELDAELKVAEAERDLKVDPESAVLKLKVEQAKFELSRKTALRAAAGLPPRT